MSKKMYVSVIDILTDEHQDPLISLIDIGVTILHQGGGMIDYFIVEASESQIERIRQQSWVDMCEESDDDMDDEPDVIIRALSDIKKMSDESNNATSLHRYGSPVHMYNTLFHSSNMTSANPDKKSNPDNPQFYRLLAKVEHVMPILDNLPYLDTRVCASQGGVLIVMIADGYSESDVSDKIYQDLNTHSIDYDFTLGQYQHS